MRQQIGGLSITARNFGTHFLPRGRNLSSVDTNLNEEFNFAESTATKQTKVAFQWVPFHCGFGENYMADLLAERGNGYSPKVFQRRSSSTTKREINRMYKKCFRCAAASTTKTNLGRSY
ncbi:hypothetical protein TNCV_1259761 [Trichonephila clavipes]|nr:hypothetical protein TNCV_1259761 [Trichonephila clavipes]